jgi:gamma-glutamyltranspeptidase/glutathione hydrolase
MPVLADNVVATSQPLASQAGMEMMVHGGNAVDAALAAAIALTVVEPTGTGIGSDAFALVWDGSTLHGLNGSGRSPLAWSRKKFQAYTRMPELGWDAVTVPGAVDAWYTLWQRFGKLPFARLFQPAIRYAENGFQVTPRVASLWAEAPQRFAEFGEFKKVFLPGGRPPKAGERFVCRDQAQTLLKIADSHGEVFYRGEIAHRIAAQANTDGAALTLEDLATHHSEWVDPLLQDYHGIRLHEIPPNSQGLAALLALGILQHLNIDRLAANSADSIHLQVEAMKIAFAEIRRHVADPITMNIDPRDLLDPTFTAQTAEKIRMDRASFPRGAYRVGKGTVYLTAADDSGLMVSFIQSNYMGFGSGIVIPGTGISLQNRGVGFNLKDGHPNCVGGGKRPYHTIIPAFVTDAHGNPLLSFGVMGGHMQPQGHVQMIVRLFDQGFNPQAACDAPRWCVLENYELALEPGFDPKVIEALHRRGHTIVPNPAPMLFGGAQLIARLEEGYCAASDPRKDGQAVGF